MLSHLFIFLLGLAVGSFLNVVIHRLETKESILFSRSHCPHCGAILKWFDLIPLISFVLTWGHCRYCGRKISLQYPLVELATGILFVLIFQSAINSQQLTISNLLIFCYLLIVICFLLVIFVYDLKHCLIPDKIVYPAIGLAFVYQLFIAFDFALLRSGSNLYLELVEGFIPYLLSAFLASGFFLSLVLFSKGKWMGLGDVKLAILMGLVLGWPNILLALFLSFVSGAIVGLALIVAGKKTLKSQIPFGPFLAGSTILVLLYGSQLVEGIFRFFIF